MNYSERKKVILGESLKSLNRKHINEHGKPFYDDPEEVYQLNDNNKISYETLHTIIDEGNSANFHKGDKTFSKEELNKIVLNTYGNGFKDADEVIKKAMTIDTIRSLGDKIDDVGILNWIKKTDDLAKETEDVISKFNTDLLDALSDIGDLKGIDINEIKSEFNLKNS